ncbi:60S ribosomal protein L38 [Plasmodium brasilianum]|uniref:60S ribosomal protein L38 n=1 Tax=Plasmodium brasilianum TaxID=5824 RepID=A0ACB9YAN0_PLABR|nr:60S ribosomal protein L38 [Plasmodium brasilianum]
MPKQITDIRKFLKISRKPDTTAVIIVKKKSRTKKNTIITKLKLRTKRYLYTMVFSDRKKAERIENSLQPRKKLNKKRRNKFKEEEEEKRLAVNRDGNCLVETFIKIGILR